ncbi:hypothetical protein Tco_0083529 [Tanacetum coccineum]
MKNRVHSTFHVSKLKKCMADEPLAIPLDEIQVDDKLNFIEEPVEIMDREFTWEREDQMQKKYPHLFTNSAPAAEVSVPSFDGDKAIYNGEKNVTPEIFLVNKLAVPEY